MPSKKKRIILVLLLIAVCALGIFLFKKEEAKGPKDQVTIYGNIDIREIQLAFYAEGRITKLYADEGKFVKAGELLGELDRDRYEARLNALNAKVKEQEEIVTRLHNGSRPQEIRAAKARMEKAKARLRDAKITYKRLLVLSKTKYVSRQKLDDAKAQLDMAKEALKEAKEIYDLKVIGPRIEDIKAAEEKLKALRAELSLSKVRLKDTWLYAPSNGIIRDRILEPGDMAFPNRPVYTLALTNPLWVRAYIPEPDLGKIALGMPAQITVDSFPDKTFKGWVGYISPTAEFTPRNVETPDLRTRIVYQVRVYVCNHEGKLRLGMPATVKIFTKRKRKEGNLNPSTICSEDQSS